MAMAEVAVDVDAALAAELRRLDAVRKWLRNPRHNVVPYPILDESGSGS
jgi:hypothetical protein